VILFSEDQRIAESALKKASIRAVDGVAVGVEGLPEIGAIASLDEQDVRDPVNAAPSRILSSV